MSQDDSTATAPTKPIEPPAATPIAKPTTRVKPKLLPPHVVILHNDSINGIDYVVQVLRQVLRCSSWRAVTLTLRAHFTGRAAVWSGSLEVAELKAEQLTAAGADPRKMDAGARPLRVSIEPLPG